MLGEGGFVRRGWLVGMDVAGVVAGGLGGGPGVWEWGWPGKKKNSEERVGEKKNSALVLLLACACEGMGSTGVCGVGNNASCVSRPHTSAFALLYVVESAVGGRTYPRVRPSVRATVIRASGSQLLLGHVVRTSIIRVVVSLIYLEESDAY